MLGTDGPRQPRRRRVGFALVAGLATLVPSVFAHAQEDGTTPPSSAAPETVEEPPTTASTTTAAPTTVSEPTTTPAETTSTTSTTVPSETTASSTTAPPATAPSTTTTVVPPPTTVVESVDAAAASCRVRATVTVRDYGPDVECLERALVRLGHRLNGPNLYYDNTTVTAVQTFQRNRGLPADGIARPATLNALGIWTGGVPANCTVASALRVRSLNVSVQCLENRLVLLGHTLNGPNRYYDNTTVVAVQAFQRGRRIPANGIAGPATLNALGVWSGPVPTNCRSPFGLKTGDFNDSVPCLEARLIARGYRLNGPNFYFDSTTTNAVRAYQRTIGVMSTGVADPYTLYRLGVWTGPTPSQYGLPANSGSGRRVVYSRSQQRVWAVDANGVVVKTHRVSGRTFEPRAGTYSVYSRSMYTYAANNPSIKWRYMVRFAYGDQGGRIGFHEIPTQYGRRLQTDAQLGQPLSGGCVRQSTADAQWMWNWAYVGTKVVVL